MYADAGFGFAAAYSSSHQPAPLDFSFSSGPAPPLPQDAYAAMPLIADTAHLGNMVQPSLVSEYDLGGEGDLFKAPEPIIDEPLLSLDPVAAAISMMSGSETAMDQTIKAGTIQNDPLLSEVLYECEKELMEKSAIEETISELLDVKIPMLQVEETPRQVEEALIQKSVSSGCLNSADWINGAVRPNFLDFQGMDFEAAFGMRRAYSEGDIQNLGANTPRPANAQSSCERLVTISDLKTEERKQKLSSMLVEKLWQTASQECEGDLRRLKNATCSSQISRWQDGEAARDPPKSLMELELLEACGDQSAPPSGTKVERHLGARRN
ncbi:hypothetical protein PR202_ga06164 [Eleusine coracana subsp. coracana]|uniref:Uncharacterized protein n=1 Tax=Eleusine coracana subsp. coracana TaxID=191504 RepID=A0AAV5BXN8_ELECO|nr:hypothetical protein PR202_ga06164 [Eleusine coracana subsp. coracana]